MRVAAALAAIGAIVSAIMIVWLIRLARSPHRGGRVPETMLDESQRLAGVGSWCLDLTTGGVTWSPQLYELLHEDSTTAKPSMGLLVRRVHPDDLGMAPDTARTTPERFRPTTDRFRVHLDSGETRVLLSSVTVLRNCQQRPTHLLGTIRDITDLHDLQERTAQLRTVVETTPDAVFSVTTRGLIASWNPAAQRLFGYAPEEILGRDSAVLEPQALADTPRSWYHRVSTMGIPADAGTIMGYESVLLHQDGADVPVTLTMAPIRDSAGAPMGASVIARDLSERRQLEFQLVKQARTDPLTRLANRDMLMTHLHQVIERGRLSTRSTALLLIDIDDFKLVNDMLGHYAGDRLLMAIAGRLRTCARSGDMVARLGGDEFAVIIPEVGESGAREFARRVTAALQPGVDLGGTVASARASIGIALHNTVNRDDPDTLLRKAELAMYAAKREAKGGYRLFADEIQSAFTQQVELEADLRRAVATDEFHLHYQPIVSLRSGQITGFEALLRWNRPDRRQLGPDMFIPVLESTGLITDVGDLVLREACLQASAWQKATGTRMSINVNVSPPQLNEASFVRRVTQALQRAELPPQCLTLEITEGVMVANVEQVVARLTELRALGVRMAIDDFGTGYSSLRYLQTLPMDTVKIDRSFIAKIQDSQEQAALARAIVDIGHALNLVVVAEGVENEEQATILQTIGCEYAQGFHFARPQEASSITTMLANLTLTQA